MVTFVGCNAADPIAPVQYYRFSLAGNFFAGGAAPADLWDQLAAVHLIPVSPRPAEGGILDSSGSAVPGLDASAAVIDARTEAGIAAHVVSDLGDLVSGQSLTLSVTRIEKIAASSAGNPTQLSNQLDQDKQSDTLSQIQHLLEGVGKWIVIVLVLLLLVIYGPAIVRLLKRKRKG